MTVRPCSASGFGLVEALVAAAILTLLIGAIGGLVDPAYSALQAQPEASDVHQRLRVGVDTLSREIRAAGAGPYRGTAGSTLSSYRAAILPYRVGPVRSDPGQGVFFRSDTITLVYVPAVPTRQPPDDAVHLRADGTLPIQAVPDGALAQVVAHTYYLRDDAASDTVQLRRYDGLSTDSPVVDHVVHLAFEYFGEPVPPAVLTGGDASALPRVTYGPAPPPLDVDVPGDAWPAGENCAILVADGAHVPRLAILGPPDRQVALASALLTDGPWCPDAAAPERWDADLLRIRRVRGTVRVEASASAFRGPAGVLFTRGGTSRLLRRFVPDAEVSFDVSPPNLRSIP